MLSDTTIAAFKASLRGQLITPGDAQYDEARKVYNAMIDRRPGLIARCADVADVQTAVNFAREQKLLVSIRGGGHNAIGLGVCDDGLVIDLSAMRYVRVDPKKKTDPRRRRIALGRRRSCRSPIRPRRAFRNHLDDRRWRPDARRRHRAPDSPVRPEHRQHPRRRHGARRRPVRHRERQGELGSLLGRSRRRRQLRRRHVVSVQGASGPHQLRRPDALGDWTTRRR